MWLFEFKVISSKPHWKLSSLVTLASLEELSTTRDGSCHLGAGDPERLCPCRRSTGQPSPRSQVLTTVLLLTAVSMGRLISLTGGPAVGSSLPIVSSVSVGQSPTRQMIVLVSSPARLRASDLGAGVGLSTWGASCGFRLPSVQLNGGASLPCQVLCLAQGYGQWSWASGSSTLSGSELMTQMAVTQGTPPFDHLWALGPISRSLQMLSGFVLR